MAFVFSTQRWKEQPANDWVPGPGAYIHQDNCMEEPIQQKRICKGKAFPKTPPSNENSLQYLSIKTRQERKHKLMKEKKRPYFQPWKSIPNKKQNLMTVKSFVPRKLNERLSAKSQKVYFKLDIEPTNPSIKNSRPSNFYVGPADNKVSDKIIHSQPQSQKMKTKQRSKLGEQMKNSWLEEEDEASFYGELFKEVKQTLRKKPATANHPFRKRNQLKQKQQNTSDTQLPTGISDQDSFGSQTDTPGPGYYNIQKKPSTTKKSMMFTEYKERFNGIYPSKETGSTSNQVLASKKQRNKSRACQSRVGFGSSVRSKVDQVFQKDINFKFYEDNQTIESKALQNKINDEIKPGCFNLTRDYVQQKRKEEISKEYFDAIEQNKEILKKYELSKNQITYQFKSKANRQDKSANDGDSVDYSGQQYKTIQEKLDRVQEENQEQLYFNSSEKRFIYPQNKNSELKTQLEIKHGLFPDFNGFRQRPLKQSVKKIPAYTFQKENAKENKEPGSPAPDHYSQQMPWVQKTYNKKFMPR